MNKLKRICVYCGSSMGENSVYGEAAENFGKALAESGIGLVYGGATVGLMGRVANGVLENGGEAVGVIPDCFKGDVVHEELTELLVVDSMHDRKLRMFEMADGFVALPGGMGTIEEMFEVLTWAQLKFHVKPCGLLNVGGYYDALIEFIDYAVREGFIKKKHRAMMLVDETTEGLLEKLEGYGANRCSK